MRRRLLFIMLMVALGLFGRFVDPTGGVVPYPRCPVKSLTGLDCPGCGSGRAFHALMNGRFVEAWNFNPWLPVALAFAIIALLADRRGGRFNNLIHSPVTLAVFIALSLGWMVFRNLLPYATN